MKARVMLKSIMVSSSLPLGQGGYVEREGGS